MKLAQRPVLPRSVTGVVALVAALSLHPIHVAHAQHMGGAHGAGRVPVDPAAAQIAEAQRLYDSGSRAWHAERYDEALAAFRASYELGHRPEVLYDVGITLDRLGRLEEAIQAFESYLAAMPGAPNRVAVEQRIQSLRDDVERAHADARASGSVVPTRIEPRRTGPVMTLMGAPSSGGGATMRPELVEIGGPPPPPPGPTVHGPEWIASWVFLALTAGSSLTAGLLWNEGQAHFQLLLDDCTNLGGCTEAEIADSPAHGYQDATNAMLGVSIGLGAITLLSFILEGALGGGPDTVVMYGDLELRLDARGVTGTF